MKEFKVWTEGYEESPDTVFAWSPTQAAEEYVSGNHANLDYTECIDVLVRDPDGGAVTEWTVEVESEPVFRASEKKGKRARD